jgi:hypothetical protein
VKLLDLQSQIDQKRQQTQSVVLERQSLRKQGDALPLT